MSLTVDVNNDSSCHYNLFVNSCPILIIPSGRTKNSENDPAQLATSKFTGISRMINTLAIILVLTTISCLPNKVNSTLGPIGPSIKAIARTVKMQSISRVFTRSIWENRTKIDHSENKGWRLVL